MTRVCPACGRRFDLLDPTWRCCSGPDGRPLPLVLAEPPAAPPSPARLRERPWDLGRYAESLGVPQEAWRLVTLGEGATPLLPAGPRVDGVWVKAEYLSPTLSFKDRGAVLLLAAARAARARRVVVDSSGNAGTAVAAYAARAGLPAEVYVPESTSPQKLAQVRAHGARLHLVPGRREDAAAAAARAADEPGTRYASHVYDPLFHLGTATFVYEVWEQLGGRLPDVFVLPVGNGTLVLGVALGCAVLHAAGHVPALPRIVAVQAATCAPLGAAWRSGNADPVPVHPGPTLAEGIAIAAPARGAEILRAVAASGGAVVTVTDEELLAARADLAERGWYVENTAAVCWAAVRRLRRGPGAPDDPVLTGEVVLPLTGAGAKTGWSP